MVAGLVNANPIVYERKEQPSRNDITSRDESTVEAIDEQEVFDHLRDIKDPEHPYSLEQLKVLSEDAIEVDDERSHVDIRVAPGTHQTEAAVNKQLNDKERIAAALENPNLLEVVDLCLAPTNN